MNFIQSIKSYLVSLQASGCVGKSERLVSKGTYEEASRVARKGLALLARPYVIRNDPAAGSILIVLTLQLEHLSNEHNLEGASENDLADAYQLIKTIYPDDSKGKEYRDWLPYLESRLGIPEGGGSPSPLRSSAALPFR